LSRNGTEILFINHSSLLIKYYNKEFQSRYLLLDPWHTRPAFGSWLPNFHQYVNPTYIAALGEKLTILISHAHDDHCDDELLALFDKKTRIVTAKFHSGSVRRRLEALGFTNILECPEEGIELESLQINSFVNREISFDDALYSISLVDCLIIHANDNWFQLSESIKSQLKDN
jgi:L-ascorbate metabolism protein UlaG (beta-lactamase superfamily)